jgi:hypothetical protein
MSGELSRVIFITQFSPSAIGHGGNHRAYQIVHDLETALGTDCVQVLSLLPSGLNILTSVTEVLGEYNSKETYCDCRRDWVWILGEESRP